MGPPDLRSRLPRTDWLAALPVVAGVAAFVKCRHLGAVELHRLCADSWVVEVEHPQLVADFHDRLDTHVVVAVELGVASERLQLRAGVGQVVAVGIDDRHAERAVTST